jgi:hypothetical protein
LAAAALISLIAYASPGVAKTETYLSPAVPSGITLSGPASLDEMVAAGELPPVSERLPVTVWSKNSCRFLIVEFEPGARLFPASNGL